MLARRQLDSQRALGNFPAQTAKRHTPGRIGECQCIFEPQWIVEADLVGDAHTAFLSASRVRRSCARRERVIQKRSSLMFRFGQRLLAFRRPVRTSKRMLLNNVNA